MEADVTIIGVDTEILMAFYVENNTSQDKNWILIMIVQFMYVPKRRCLPL